MSFWNGWYPQLRSFRCGNISTAQAQGADEWSTWNYEKRATKLVVCFYSCHWVMCFRYISAYISYISWDLLIKQIIPSLQNLHSISNHRNHPLKHCYASHRNTTLTGTCSRSLHLTNWIQFASNHNCQVGECVFWVKKDTSIILFGSMTMNRQYVLYIYIYIYALTQHKKHTLEKK